MPKWTKSKTITQLYKDYRYRKNKEHKYYLTSKRYREIILSYIDILTEELIKGNTYYLPYGMGEFRITKYRPKYKPRNFQAELRYFKRTGEWKKIPLQNFHTDSDRIRIGWFTRDYPLIPNKRLIRFSSVRSFRKKISSKLLTEGNIQDYYKVQKSTRLHKQKTLI